MPPPPVQLPHVVIACGGTGGHLYPGLAIGERLLERGAEVTLAISAKDVDQHAVRGDARFRILTLPAIGFSSRRALAFAAASLRSWRLARAEFRKAPVHAFLAMGAFTSAPPAWAAHGLGCPVFLHEGNAIPGRANRWLARIARRAYVYFPEAAHRLRRTAVQVVGMPVRQQFLGLDPVSCRMALGLDVRRPVLLVTGGSQGASGVNRALLRALPEVFAAVPELQLIHLTGPRDEREVREAHAQAGRRAVVRAFLTEMDFALGAADAVVARAGASSAAEIAAVGVPALLIPYPHAADGHQDANARALEGSGAAVVVRESEAAPERLAPMILRLLRDEPFRASLRAGLTAWHRPDADAVIADDLLAEATGLGPDRAGSGAAAKALLGVA